MTPEHFLHSPIAIIARCIDSLIVSFRHQDWAVTTPQAETRTSLAEAFTIVANQPSAEFRETSDGIQPDGLSHCNFLDSLVRCSLKQRFVYKLDHCKKECWNHLPNSEAEKKESPLAQM